MKKADDLVVKWQRIVWFLQLGSPLKENIPNLLVLHSFRGHVAAKLKSDDVLWNSCGDDGDVDSATSD